MDPDYKKVIGILFSKPNYEALVWEIAKEHPKVVNDAYDLCSKVVAPIKATAKSLIPTEAMVNQKLPEDFYDMVVHYLKCGQKVEAIKYVRSYTLWSLKEAKDWVDSIVL